MKPIPEDLYNNVYFLYVFNCDDKIDRQDNK